MVPDHERQGQAVELGTPRPIQLRELLSGQHSGHQHGRIHARHRVVSGVRLRNGLMPLPEPALHEGDLVALAYDDSLAQGAHGRTRSVRGRPAGDQHRLRVVADHAGHEVHVG